MSQKNSDQIAVLRSQVRRLRTALFAALLACAGLAGASFYVYSLLREEPGLTTFVQAGVPNAKIVENVIEPLKYSGYQDFIRPEVYLEFDFEKRLWKLGNIHRYDASGKVLLNEGRYGVCDDLAVHTYETLLPHFPPDRYRFQFVRAAEASYFQEGSAGNHIILRIADLSSGQADGLYSKVYVIDPALRRYGTPEVFDNYRPLGGWTAEEFIRQRTRDSVFHLNYGPPILITRKVIVSLYVLENEGRFDADNYLIHLTGTRRYQYTQRPLLVVRKSDGKVAVEENDFPVKQVIGRQQYERLKQAVLRLQTDLEKRLAAERQRPAG